MVLSRDNYRTRFRSSAVLPLSLTISLTPWRLEDLLYVTLAYADDNSKLVDVVTVANVIDEDCVGNSLLQIWKLRFGHKAKLLFRLSAVWSGVSS